ncbi:hypothetical protein QE152_g27043 [Popillia japonica]|uniref:tetrahydrofolate synthase n=1 Tax=Popillia japonica TaxID=7064 RepID=A0AAW1JUQ7_POPJA
MDKYKEAVDALNNLQSNAAYIKERSNLKISYNEEYERFLQMKKYLRSAGISREKLNNLQVIHVAGTKGKGSTCAFCESILRYHGYKTGFYSSPHLLEVRERIRIDGEPISHDMFAQNFWYIYNRLSKDFPENLPVYFRFLTIMAFHIFLKEKVDVAVIEVGIGGELDCTNVLERVPVVGITSLGIDHTNLLGSTIEEIAWHKSGIFKENSKAYTVPQPANAMKILLERSKERKTSIEVIHPFVTIEDNGRSIPEVFNLNASLAVTLAYSWLKTNSSINISLKEFADHPSTKQGLANFNWPGRYQIIFHNQVNYYLDGAHTPESMEICVKWFKAATKKSPRIKVLIFNMTGERDVERMLKSLLHCDFYKVFFVPNISGRTNITDNKIRDVSIHVNKCNKHRKLWIELLRNNNIGVDESQIMTKLSVHEAVKEISQKPYDCLVTGSLHLMGAALDVLDPHLQQTHIKKEVAAEEPPITQGECKSSHCPCCKLEEADVADNHLPSGQCSFDYDMALIINPYADVREDRSLKSACLKCTACLAVAENVNKSFTEYYYEKLANKVQGEDFLCHTLDDLCVTGFKNYDLREYNGTKFITKASRYNTHVNTKMDGKWTQLLRNLCKMYIQHINIHDVLQKDCRNLEMESGSINTKSDNNEEYVFAAGISISCFE